MQALLILLLAFAPGVFWLWFFAKRDAYRPEPKRLIALTFGFGMIATIPAGVLNELFLDEDLLDSGAADLAPLAAGMLFVVGPVEETCKFLAVHWYAFRSLYFDEPSDGLVYAAAAGLGFASIENVLYIINFGPEVMLARAPLSTAAHVIFASFWGVALGRRTQGGGRLAVAVGLLAAAVMHGLFNVSVTVAPLGGLAFVGVGVWWVPRRFRWANRVSPFRYRRNVPQTVCSSCGRRISVSSRFCGGCGSARAPSTGPIWCGRCGQPQQPNAAYCSRCGDRLEMI